MDAVKLIKEFRRMCDAHASCESCPAEECECQLLEHMAEDTKIVAIVEGWSAAHPRKTRQSVFLEQYPEARVDDVGVLRVCPAIVSAAHRGDEGGCSDTSKECATCRCEFWMQEVE